MFFVLGAIVVASVGCAVLRPGWLDENRPLPVQGETEPAQPLPVRMTDADVERVVAVADRMARKFGMVSTPALELEGSHRRDEVWTYRTLGYFPRGAAFNGSEGLAFAIVIQLKKDGSELLVAVDDLGKPRPLEFIRQLGRELRNDLTKAFSGYQINVRDRTWLGRQGQPTG